MFARNAILSLSWLCAAACSGETPLAGEQTGCSLVSPDAALETIDRGESELARTSDSDTSCSYVTEDNELVRWELYAGVEFEELVSQGDWPEAEPVAGVGDRALGYSGVISERLATAHLASSRDDDLIVVVVRVNGAEPPTEAAAAVAKMIWRAWR